MCILPYHYTRSLSYYYTLFARDFAAMGSSLFDPHAQFPLHSAEWTVWLLRFEIYLTLSTVGRSGLELLVIIMWSLSDHYVSIMLSQLYVKCITKMCSKIVSCTMCVYSSVKSCIPCIVYYLHCIFRYDYLYVFWDACDITW